MSYKHIFFDLDRTLWDFDKNSEETLLELYDEFDLNELTDVPAPQFVIEYQTINERLWADYRAGTIGKEELRSSRFKQAFDHIEIEDHGLADRFGEVYLSVCPLKTKLIDGADELLGELHEKYDLHLITNGFEETQHIKIKAAAIGHFFDEIITSEAAGARKPDPKIFELALNRSGAHLKDSLMIGDDHEADIQGAQRFGMDQVHYAPSEEEHASSNATYVVRDLNEIRNFL